MAISSSPCQQDVGPKHMNAMALHTMPQGRPISKEYTKVFHGSTTK